PIIHLREKYRVRLLPDQKRMDLMRPLPSARPDRLRPTRTQIALRLRRPFRYLKNPRVNLQAWIGLWPPVPQSPMGGVPPNHLHVKLPIPSIVDQPAFLWRIRTRLVHRH